MKIMFSVNTYDKDGDIVDRCVQLYLPAAKDQWGKQLPQTVIQFNDSNELEEFANDILKILPEIRENENNN